MLSIRFSRTGKKHQPYFRILVQEKLRDPQGKFVEIIGNYNPRTKELSIKEDRAKYWLGVGAKPSDTVHRLLAKKNLIKPLAPKKFSIKKKGKEEKKPTSLPDEAPSGVKMGLPDEAPSGAKAGLPDEAPSGAKAGLPDEAPSGAKAGAKASVSAKATAGKEPTSAKAMAGKGEKLGAKTVEPKKPPKSEKPKKEEKKE